MTDMSDGSQMVFTFRVFLLIEKTDSRVFESSDGGGKLNGSSKVRRPAFGHMSIRF